MLLRIGGITMPEEEDKKRLFVIVRKSADNRSVDLSARLANVLRPWLPYHDVTIREGNRGETSRCFHRRFDYSPNWGMHPQK